ncbi:MAG: hypothetical protein ACFFD9_03915 [Candidatus Thorarchaeota archaeon]
MVDPNLSTGFNAAIDFQYPMVDLVAVIPYALPLLFIGIVALLYQRHLPRDILRRNLLVLGGIISLAAASVMILYAGFGSMWWIDGVEFGSYGDFVGIVQALTDFVYGSMFIGLLYIVGVVIVVGAVALRAISPPDPDFVALRGDLKEAQDSAKSMKADIQKLDGENKQLQEFLTERESSLTAVQAQLDAIKAEISEREKAMSQMQAKMAEAAASPEREEELLTTITNKDQTISNLQSEIAHLKAAAESTAAPEIEAKYRDYVRRAETASEVSDSVISDLAELISQVESSKMDASAQIALTTLIKSMGRAMGRVSAETAGKPDAEPKIELIGAVMMAHEVVDSVKRMTRAS